MAASRHDMCDVELVEEDDAPVGVLPGHGAPGTGPDAGVPRGRDPSGRGWTLTAAGVLVLGVVVGDATADARARAGRAALDRVPGVVAPLDTPPAELWRSDPTLRPELGEAGGHLVGVMGARGAAEVVGLDPATGAVVWRTVVRERGPGDGGGVGCVVPEPVTSPGASATPTVVCVVDRATPRGAAVPADAAPEDRLLTLDARDGTVLADRVVERSTVLSALGQDVVTGHVDAAGHIHVVRTDPLGDAVRWSFVTPRPLPRSHLAWATSIGVEDGVVVVDEADGWVLSADGEVLHSWVSQPAERVEGTASVVGSGRFVTRPRLDGGPTERSEVTDLESGRTFVVDGRPLPTWPDDGSLGALLLVRPAGDGGLVAHDASGEPAWGVEGSVQGRALVVDGRLVRVGPTDLAAIDGRTGAVLWSTPLVRTARTSLVTDGRLALTTALDPEAGVVLRAHGLDDGRLRWTVDLPDDVGALTAFGDRLFGWTGQQLVALGVPAP